MKKYLLLFSISVLSACATPNITYDTELKAEEGVLLTKVICQNSNIPIISAAFYRIDQKQNSFLGPTEGGGIVVCKEPYLKILKVKEGEYYFGNVGQLKIKKNNAYKFKIERNKANYIGNVVLSGRFQQMQNTLYLGLSVRDSEKLILDSFKDKYPDLYNKYEYVNALAKK